MKNADIRLMTLVQIRKLGIEILNQHLGIAGMIRFLQQGETGWGDYTKDREKWLGNPDLKELFDAVKKSETDNAANINY